MTYSEHIKLFFPNGTEGYSYEQILASMDLVPSTFKYNEQSKEYVWTKHTKAWKDMTADEARNLLHSNSALNRKNGDFAIRYWFAAIISTRPELDAVHNTS